MTDAELRRFHRRSRAIARKSGFPHLQDDFAQQVILLFLENPERKSTLEQLWIDFLRKEYGRTVMPNKKITRSKLSTHIQYESLAHQLSYQQKDIFFDYSHLFHGKVKRVYEFILQDLSFREIAKELKLHPSRITQIYQENILPKLREFLIHPAKKKVPTTAEQIIKMKYGKTLICSLCHTSFKISHRNIKKRTCFLCPECKAL